MKIVRLTRCDSESRTPAASSRVCQRSSIKSLDWGLCKTKQRVILADSLGCVTLFISASPAGGSCACAVVGAFSQVTVLRSSCHGSHSPYVSGHGRCRRASWTTRGHSTSGYSRADLHQFPGSAENAEAWYVVFLLSMGLLLFSWAMCKQHLTFVRWPE